MMKRKKDSLPQTWPDKFKEAKADEERVYACSNNREYYQAYKTPEELDEIIRPLVNATLYYADVKQKIQ